MDTSALRASARESLSDQDMAQVSDSLLEAVAGVSVVIMGLLAVAMMGILLWMVFLVKNRSRRAGMARRLLLVFGFYFAFRILVIFLLTPGGSDVPLAMYAVDGSLQIIGGVAGLLTLLLGFRAEMLKWTGEINDKPGEGGPRRSGGGPGTDPERKRLRPQPPKPPADQEK